jgi:hypothetical protein
LPGNAAQLLRSATVRVARACNLSPYDNPNATAVTPLADATCAQVASWVALNLDPASLGLDTAPVKSSSMLGGSVVRDTTGQTAARQVAAAQLAPEAVDILLQAGLLWQPVPVGADPDDQLPDWGSGPFFSPWTDPLSGEVQFPEPLRWPYE